VSFYVTGQRLRTPVQDIYKFDERRILDGRVESGSLEVGDRLVFSPTNKVSTVKGIERWNSASNEAASAGESIGIIGRPPKRGLDFGLGF